MALSSVCVVQVVAAVDVVESDGHGGEDSEGGWVGRAEGDDEDRGAVLHAVAEAVQDLEAGRVLEVPI